MKIAVSANRTRMSRGKPTALSESEVRALAAMMSGGSVTSALRARIVLMSGEGLDYQTISGKVRLSARTVAKWHRRFVAGGVEGLKDAPRTGAPRSVDHAAMASIIDREKLVNPDALNARAIAREANVSVSTITRALRAARTACDVTENEPSITDKRVAFDGAQALPPSRKLPADADLKLAFYMAPVGLLVARQRVIEAYNETFCGMFGYDSDALAGRSLEFLYPSREEFQHIGSRAMVSMRDSGLYSDERIMRRVDESLFWCHVSGRTMNRDDPLAAAVWCFEDISSVRRVANNLTPREREVAQLLVIGKSSKQIGRDLKISFRTVEAHRARLMRKYGVASISGLIAFLVGRHDVRNGAA